MKCNQLQTCINSGVVPILFDMSTESAHPVSEELSSTIMVLGNQIMCDIFTAIIQFHFGMLQAGNHVGCGRGTLPGKNSEQYLKA